MDKTRKCPLLVKYNYPFNNASDSQIGDWYKDICLTYCPLQDACVYDWRGKIPAVIKEKLEKVAIPCPKCGAVDNWQIKEDDGLTCLHCGERIYWSKVSKTVKDMRKEVK